MGWGIYHDYSVQKYLLEQIEEAETNAAKNNYPVNGPCLARHGNDHQCVRKRYLVSNSKRLPNGKEELVYVVKTFQGTGNDQTWWDSETDEEMYFHEDGDKRERHNVDTIGEFKIGRGRDRIWYTVYWRCRKRNHDRCRHDYKEMIEKQTPTPSPDMEVPEWEKHHKYLPGRVEYVEDNIPEWEKHHKYLPGRVEYVAPQNGNHGNAYHFQDHEKLTVTSKPWTEEGLFADDFTDDTDG